MSWSYVPLCGGHSTIGADAYVCRLQPNAEAGPNDMRLRGRTYEPEMSIHAKPRPPLQLARYVAAIRGVGRTGC